ncbi:hypothetical protein SAMN05216353_107103 [Halobacillus alkaliphilus]|uniref:Uncharacterized protein n=1 Tax=Halobacillus alkaliphilus TaxID=396056 RepID=A0A1I2L5V9_9BACI|nr:hypothetical protein [Halobacillus alkaliphilus]SFF73938.1 hypothetical protein SAMN05216353_107103 [Halobacillus alkaliphilus]
MNKIRIGVGLIGNLIVCFWGVNSLLTGDPILNHAIFSYLFAIGGFISFIALIMELRKKERADNKKPPNNP